MPRQGLHVAWLGDPAGECGQLLQRVATVCSERGRPLTVDHLSIDDWERAVASTADRIVIAAETRLEYPWHAVARLRSWQACAPWGVVTGLWHAGSRRTGIGTVTHWQMPWYRWWDGWHGWFFPELARPGSLSPAQFEALFLPIDLATPAEPSSRAFALPGPRPEGSRCGDSDRERGDKKLLIVSACSQTAQTWRLEAERAGWAASVMRHGASAQEYGPPPATLLWDDSCQDRLPGIARTEAFRTEAALEQCRRLARCYVGVPIIAALALGHLGWWPQFQAAGISDFIIKPSYGLPLADYLVYHTAAYQGARTG